MYDLRAGVVVRRAIARPHVPAHLVIRLPLRHARDARATRSPRAPAPRRASRSPAPHPSAARPPLSFTTRSTVSRHVAFCSRAPIGFITSQSATFAARSNTCTSKRTVRPARLRQESHRARERMPRHRAHRHPPALELHDANLHVPAQRQRERQHSSQLRHAWRAGFRLDVEVPRRALREMRHEMLEQLLRRSCGCRRCPPRSAFAAARRRPPREEPPAVSPRASRARRRASCLAARTLSLGRCRSGS